MTDAGSGRVWGTIPPTRLPGGLRKKPLQERSKAAIRNVLDVAAQIVLEQGVDALVGSPTLLLERSGFSKGSFYAFFETPDSVLDELALQCMLDSREEQAKLFSDPGFGTWTEFVDALVDQYCDWFRIPLVRAIWVGQRFTANTRLRDRIWIEEMAVMLHAELSGYEGCFENLTLTQCEVVVEVLERLGQVAFRDDPDGSESVIDEMRTLVHGYLAVCQ
ncbi:MULTISPECIES: TetR/AcrR family transcriptional regulator [Gordonia]|uniref:TetR/AcrR family transcriptional regulator n=1 Tax=Gordonia amicalis TaxID=89053 RepID=A0AAE4UAN9_9ACTN|nr:MULTISPECIES: TetR/AcrR family transcriptional regulator [Gordonia]KAF0970951.1 hypothetical protein BPODLACK_00133 [Gordonia sp. YY1]MCZ0911498.1 TetR/AcrR family transcriptional regulator [Gordonia amicalis]MCZ4580122.1 TetR/AcrR family transcriptional regulator [Gordonia amicalis]MCZ4649988.1 TetR/AcrR family transcriptional regulator [Gordonia amicalis]MDJ0453329.1 TetR/AcrR family transcriptional regulator [Gordonia amicalis]